jgi:hypothetical protein
MPVSVKSKKSGKSYYLNTKEVLLRGGRKQRIFYFASDLRAGAPTSIPAGYEVIENARTGLPMLRKAKKK